MKHVVAVLLFAVVLCGLASAQTSGYAFVAPTLGDGGNGIGLGGGAKYMLKDGLGAGADYTFVGSTTDFRNSGFSLISANGYYQFKAEGKLKPFVTAGYSRSFMNGADANFANLGGGVNYWFKSKAGLLLEFRDFLNRDSGVTGQLWQVRMGLSFK
jgi:hypothetical protein